MEEVLQVSKGKKSPRHSSTTVLALLTFFKKPSKLNTKFSASSLWAQQGEKRALKVKDTNLKLP